MASSKEKVTAGDALALIGEVEPSALKMVGDIMEYNSGATAWGFEQAYLGEKAAHERTQERLKQALRQLDLIEFRVGWLLGHHDDLFQHPFD